MVQGLKQLRKTRGLKAQAMATKLGVSVQTYYKYENNERDIPTDLLLPLAEILDVSVDYLLRGTPADKKDFIRDFVAYAERHFGDDTVRIIQFLTKYWSGNFRALVHMAGAYAALEPEVRKDISALTIYLFRSCPTDQEVSEAIDIKLLESKLSELANK